MAHAVDLDGLRALVERGAQLVDVLPTEEYEALHLPNALHLPLKELDAERANALLGRSRTVVVYCWDGL